MRACVDDEHTLHHESAFAEPTRRARLPRRRRAVEFAQDAGLQILERVAIREPARDRRDDHASSKTCQTALGHEAIPFAFPPHPQKCKPSRAARVRGCSP